MDAQLDYNTFLQRKTQLARNGGFSPIFLPDYLFDFQKFLVEWAIRSGRSAIFADCGLGKTWMELVWAENVVRHTNKPVLILAPLAVSLQFVSEGEKCGIEVDRSNDGTPRHNITVTNYERLEKFNPDHFAGIVADECFPKGTAVDTLSRDNVSTLTYIEDIRPGDRILNASGVDHVRACAKRRVDRVVVISIGGRHVTCSGNHPFLTVHGWRRAGNLQSGDYLLATETAVRLVRGDLCSEILGEQAGAILRSQLLGEMAYEYAGAQGEGSYARNSCETRSIKECMVARRFGSRQKRIATNYRIESYERSVICCQDDRNKNDQRDIASAHKESRWQWDWAYRARTNALRRSRQRLGGTLHSNQIATFATADALQDRLRESPVENCDRGRRSLSQRRQTESSGLSQGRISGLHRVDCVEILESSDPRLDGIRDADGSLYFYDLEATRHPSFSVEGVLVHNCSILKHWSGKTQSAVTRFMCKIPYRLLGTATPSPNDYIEMGTLSETLGDLSYSEMLATFFRQISDTEKRQKATADDVIHSTRLSWRVIQSIGQWALRAHAFEPFWRWISSWARACRKPSDLGPFDDSRFVLPPLRRTNHMVSALPPPGHLFSIPAVGLNQERAERRRSIHERCDLVSQLVRDSDSSVTWCHLNDEGDFLQRAIAGSVQVKGSQSIDEKEELLAAFLCGQAKHLVTKAKIAGLGLNMQHCAHVVTFVDHSFERFYQCVRRCYRFGQKRDVRLDVIATEGEINVSKNMERKERLMNQMFDSIVRFMNDSLAVKPVQPLKVKELPQWLNCP